MNWSSTISQEIDALSAPASLLEVMSVWSALNILPPTRDASFPNSSFNARYWFVQEMLNANSDLVTLPSALNNVDKVNLLAAQSYRMLSEYQVRYLVGNDAKMIRDSVTSIGSPDTPGGLARLSLSGKTKMSLPSWCITVLNTLGVPNNGSQLLIPPIENTYSGAERIDRVGGRIALYTSGRVGYEASYVNYALFHRDVPYIFNEGIFTLDTAGRDRDSSLPLSVNRRWLKNGATGGTIHFNEIAIYRRRNGSEQYLLDRVFSIGSGANMLQFFIDSVPYGQFGVRFPGSTIPDPHQFEPVPETPDSL